MPVRALKNAHSFPYKSCYEAIFIIYKKKNITRKYNIQIKCLEFYNLFHGKN